MGLAGLYVGAAAAARRADRWPALVEGRPVPRPEQQRALPPLLRAGPRRRLARGRARRRDGAADECRGRVGHVRAQAGSDHGARSMTTTATRPSFYAVADGRGGVRHWVTLLHPPYTLW